MKLKVAQLGLLKGNHVLGAAESTAQSGLADRNGHVGTRAGRSRREDQEAVDFFIENDAPLQAVDWLKQAIPEMETAGRAIKETKIPMVFPIRKKPSPSLPPARSFFVKSDRAES